jgi:hypothetical protein
MINLKMDKTNGMQKFLAVALLAAVVYAGVLVLNKVIPPINELIGNIWKLLLYGGSLAIIGLYILKNPFMIWSTFKNISWGLTKWMIKQDPLSYMDRCEDWLSIKLERMKKAMVKLGGQRTKLRRSMDEHESTVREEVKRGKAAKELKNMTQAQLAGTRIKRSMDTLDRYGPQLKRMDKSMEFLTALSENWKVAVITMREEIEGRRTEYEMLKQNAKALNQAEAFIRGETEEGRIWKESKKALEEQVTTYMSYIEQFQKDAIPIMENAQLTKKMNEDEGLDVLDKYMKDGNLMLPNFSTKVGATDLAYEMVPAQEGKKFNL